MAKKSAEIPPTTEGGDEFRNWVLTLLDELAKAREYRLQTVAAELRELIEAQQPKIAQLMGGLDWLHTQVPGIQGTVEELQRKIAALAASGGLDEAEFKAKIDEALEPLEKRFLAALKSMERHFENDRPAIIKLMHRVDALEKKPTGEERAGLDENAVVEIIRQKMAELAPTRQGVLDENAIAEHVKPLLAALENRMESWVRALRLQFENDRPAIIKLMEAFEDFKTKTANGLSSGQVSDIVQAALAPVLREIVGIKERNEGDRTGLLTLRSITDAIQDKFRSPLPGVWVEEIEGLIKKALENVEKRVSDLDLELEIEAKRLGGLVADLTQKLADEYLTKAQIEECCRQKRIEIENWAQQKIDAEAEKREQLAGKLNDDVAAICKKIEELPRPTPLPEILEAVREDLKCWLDKTDKSAEDLAALRGEFDADHSELLKLIGAFTILDALVKTLPDKDFVKNEIAAESKTLNETLESRVEKAEKAADERLDPLEQFKTTATESLGEHARLIADLQDQMNRHDSSEAGIRFARICLMGRGIVGGLEVKTEENATIHVSKGLGLAPNGELVVADRDRYFTHYQAFTPRKGNRFLFSDPEQEKPFQVWQLLERAGRNSDEPEVFPLTPQKLSDLEQPFASDKLLLVVPHGSHLHFLLMTVKDVAKRLDIETALQKQLGDNPDADFIFGEDFSDDDETPTDEDLHRAMNPALSLPEIPLFRFGFRPDDECGPEELDETQFPDIQSLEDIYQTWLPIVSDALKAVNRTLEKLTRRYHPLFFPKLPQRDFDEQRELILRKWTVFQKQNEQPKPEKDTRHYAQYFYDWARDLINAWHELRAELLELNAELRLLTTEQQCSQFNHLLLGPAHREIQTGLAAPLRDEFRQPPIYNGNAARLEKCRLYYRRMFALAEAFYLENYVADTKLNPWVSPHENEEKPAFERLRITPSRGYGFSLSEQAIPFYYPLSTSQLSPHKFWNYRRSKTLTEDMILSYHASDNGASYTARPEAVRPLFYSLDKTDFYRIEGHIGKKEVALAEPTEENPAPRKFKVLEALRFLVQKHNLDFEVRDVHFSPPMTEEYGLNPEKARAFSESLRLLGAEHLAGVPKGGTFLVIFDAQNLAVADFSLPYRLSKASPGNGGLDEKAIFELIRKMSAECDEKVAKLEAELNGRINDLEARIKVLESKGENSEKDLTDLRNDLVLVRAEIPEIRKENSVLKQDIRDFDQKIRRLDDLETRVRFLGGQ